MELYSIDSDWQRTDHAIANLEEHMGNIARSFTELWQDFQAAIRDDREPIAPAAAGARALEIVLGAYVSAVTGQVVSLPLDRASPVYLKGIDGLTELDVWAESKTKAAGLFGLRK